MITLQLVDPDVSIALAPPILNGNFTAIQTAINDIHDLLDIATNKFRLTQVATIPNDSIESATITLTKTTGNVIVVAPNGGAATYTVDADGKITGKNITVDGV